MPTGALIGSAVLGASATVYASGKAAKAAEKQGDLQYQATQDAAAAEERMYQQGRADREPFRQVGLSATRALSGAFGLDIAPSMTGRTSVIGAQGMGGYGSTPVPGVGGVSMTARAKVPGGPAGTSPLELSGSDPYYTSPGALSDGRVLDAGGGGVDYARVLQDRPDVMAEYQRLSASADRNSPTWQQHGLDSPEGFAQWWLQNKPASDTYQAPQVNGSPQQPLTPPQPQEPVDPNAPPAGYNDPTAPTGYDAGARPDPGPGPSAYVAPERQDFGPAPTRQMTAPLDVSLGSFRTSPGYEFRQKEAARTVDNASSSMGRVMSGARMKALQQRSGDIADQDYTDWRNYQTGQFNVDRARGDNVYTQDLSQYDLSRGRADTIYGQDRDFGYGQSRDARGDFTTDRARSDGLYADDRSNLNSRYDTRNSSLLTLAGFGASANAQNQQAGQSFAQNQTNLTMTGAAARGNAAVNSANAFTSGVNNLVTAGSYLGGRLMSGGGANPYYNAAPNWEYGAPADFGGLY